MNVASVRNLIIWGLAAILLTVAVKERGCPGSHIDREARYERHALRDAGFVATIPERDLSSALAELVAQNEMLSAELERLRKLSPASRATAILRAKTAPTLVKDVGAPGAAETTKVLQNPCVLTAGDTLRIDVDAILNRTPRGTYAILGTAAAVRIGDPPHEIMRSPFSLDASTLEVAVDERPHQQTGWGIGPWGVLQLNSWGLGLIAISPSVKLPLIDLGVEVMGALGAGTEGPIAALGVLVRY